MGEQSAGVAVAGLENQAQDGAREDTQGNAGDGGHLQGHRHNDDHRGQQQNGIDMEHAALGNIQSVGKFRHAAHIRVAAVVLGDAQHTEEDDADHIGDGRGQHHRLDVAHNISTSHGGSQVGGVGQGGHLIAEVGAGEDRAGGHAGVHAQAEANAHQGHAHGAHGTPGGTGGQGGDGADQQGGDEEDGGMHQLQAVVDHGGHHARVDPHADQDADDDQDTDGLKGLVNAVHHHLFNVFPLVAQIQGHNGGHTHAHKHGHMHVRAIDYDADCQNGNQKHQGNQGFPYLWHSGLSGFLCLTHGSLPTFLSILCIALHDFALACIGFAFLHFLIQRWNSWIWAIPCLIPPLLLFYNPHSWCKSGPSGRISTVRTPGPLRYAPGRALGRAPRPRISPGIKNRQMDNAGCDLNSPARSWPRQWP